MSLIVSEKLWKYTRKRTKENLSKYNTFNIEDRFQNKTKKKQNGVKRLLRNSNSRTHRSPVEDRVRCKNRWSLSIVYYHLKHTDFIPFTVLIGFPSRSFYFSPGTLEEPWYQTSRWFSDIEQQELVLQLRFSRFILRKNFRRAISIISRNGGSALRERGSKKASTFRWSSAIGIPRFFYSPPHCAPFILVSFSVSDIGILLKDFQVDLFSPRFLVHP